MSYIAYSTDINLGEGYFLVQEGITLKQVNDYVDLSKLSKHQLKKLFLTAKKLLAKENNHE